MNRLAILLNSLKTQPSYTLMRGVARFKTVRHAVTSTRKVLHQRRLAAFLADCDARRNATLFPGVDAQQIASQLRRDGYAPGIALPKEIVEEIRAWAAGQPCYADRSEKHGFTLEKRADAERHMGKPILLAQYFNVAQDCPAVKRLMNDPLLLKIAGLYLESTPTFLGANLWWTFPVQALEADRHKHAHLFHRDVDDFRFFKFFFYLTDVPAGEGAHVCVVASHTHPPVTRPGDQWNIRRYTDDEIASSFPAENIREICGVAGTGFAENTLCVHKGRTPTREARLLLQLQYGLFDYGVAHDLRAPATLQRIA